MNYFHYRIFGLVVCSEIELPELISTRARNANVTIKLGKVAEHLDSPTYCGAIYESSNEELLLRIENVATYYVSNGKNIIVDPDKKAEAKEIRLFLLGSVLGAILHQNRLFPFHGSSLVHDKSAIIITGNSAAGKSSLAAGFVQKGYQFLSDDVTVIMPQKEGNFLVQPGVPHFKLWKDVTNYFGIKQNNLQMVRPQLEKYYKPFPDQFIKTPVPLKLIIQLSVTNSNCFTSYLTKGTEKFNTLRASTYRLKLVESFNQTSYHFSFLSDLSQQVDVYKVNRPTSPLQINELSDYIERTILKQH